MHRAYGHKDALLVHPIELHAPAFGVSLGVPFMCWGVCNRWGEILGFWKTNSNIAIGSLEDMPLGQGHDGGPGRVHVLSDPMSSAAATALSSVKPHFTSHTVQFNVGASDLPICCHMIPWVPTDLGSLLMCGGPDTANLFPVIPTHLSLWVGMTWGDFFGGLLNIYADIFWSLVTLGIGKRLDTLGRAGKRISAGLPVAQKIAGGFSLASGPSNLGVWLQNLIDGDGVTSDADTAAATLFGFGIRHSVRTGDTEFATPWSM